MDVCEGEWRSLVSAHGDVRPRPLLIGLLSYVPGVFDWWDRQRPMGNTASADYCLGIWRFHLDNARCVNGGSLPGAVGELGPGATLGVCIAALLDGVETSVALDAGHYADRAANLRILGELGGAGDTPVAGETLRSAVESAGCAMLRRGATPACFPPIRST